jgi:hypothetical protein
VPWRRLARNICLVEQSESVIYSLLKTGSDEDQVFAKQLRQRAVKAKEQAEYYGRMSNDQKFMRQCDILRLYSRLGGNLGISTPRKKSGQYSWPLPHGPVIEFFQAVHCATIVGKVPEPNQIKKIVQQYRKLFKIAAHVVVGEFKVFADGTVIKRNGTVIPPSSLAQ